MKRSYRSFTEYATYIQSVLEEFRDVIADMVIEIFEATIEEGFIRGVITFIDGSRLSFLEYIRLQAGTLIKLKYRYHYEDHEGRLVFRYDNAPHYRDVETFPHHKHLANGKVASSKEPLLENILEEIVMTLG